MAMPIAITLLASSVCAFIRRKPMCYWVIVVGLIVGMSLAILGAFLVAVQMGFPGAAGAFLWVVPNLCWLAYFGNRRHMFGYLRDTSAPSGHNTSPNQPTEGPR